MSKTVIVCDNCGFEGCIVNEVIAHQEPEKILMSDYIKRAINPSVSDGMHRSRHFIILCPICSHHKKYHS